MVVEPYGGIANLIANSYSEIMTKKHIKHDHFPLVVMNVVCAMPMGRVKIGAHLGRQWITMAGVVVNLCLLKVKQSEDLSMSEG